MNTDIVLQSGALMPVMDVTQALARRSQFVQFVKSLMTDGTDFGTIPGTGKPTLLKPGAEKLVSFFGLTPVFEDVQTVEDWTGADHNGEPFFYYRQRCKLYRGTALIATADGSCNSWEVKYRYRKLERQCPSCGKSSIMKSKYPPKGAPRNTVPGWYCNPKSGGCGADFPADDARIVGQQEGRIPNPDIAEQINTLLKMSQKRALIAVTLIAVNASEFFTQDIEDMPHAEEYTNAITGEIISSTPVKQPQTNGGGNNARPADEVWATWQGVSDAVAWAMKQTGGGRSVFNHANHARNAWSELQREKRLGNAEMYPVWVDDVQRRAADLVAAAQSGDLPTAEPADLLAAVGENAASAHNTGAFDTK